MKRLVPLILALSASPSGFAQTAPVDEPEAFNAHVQSTYVRQSKPAFRSLYEGPHSLTAAHERSYSFTATAAFGARLGATEAYFDGEAAQGVAFSDLQGLAGFPNGELARTSGAKPIFYRARLFVRQVIGLGGPTEAVPSGANQLASNYDRRRLVISAGNLSVLDIFDANTVSHDPRTQFMNWTVMTHGAWDFAADARGYSWGVAAEYIDEGWALRAGRFIQPKEPNGLALDRRIFRHYGDQLELSKDYAVGEQTGTVRVLGFRNRALMSRYDDALALASQTASVPDLNAVRSGDRTKVGLGLSLDHHFAPDASAFARFMHADGKTETYAFTEVDQSIAAGLAIGGGRWGRGRDTVGLAVAANALSTAHRQILQAGGQTFFLGDGRLNYGREKVLEAYYSAGLLPGVALSVDYQRLRNPGYNADRGPVSFIGLRLHVEK